VGFNLLLTRNKLDHLGGIEIEPEDDCNGKFVLATDYIGGKTGSYIERDPTRVDFCMGDVAEVCSVSAADKVLRISSI
jgi:hypothetical protein